MVEPQREREEEEHQAEQQPTGEELPEGEVIVEFTQEQAELIADAENRILAVTRELDAISRPGAQYGIPQNIEQVSLMNSIAGLMVSKGVCTMAELFVAKRLTLAEQAEGVLAAAKAHRVQSSDLVVADAGAIPDARANGRRGSNTRRRR